MMKSEKEMIYFEEVDRIKVFRGVNKQLVLGRGINRNIMEFKANRSIRIYILVSRINRNIMEFKEHRQKESTLYNLRINRNIMEFKER